MPDDARPQDEDDEETLGRILIKGSPTQVVNDAISAGGDRIMGGLSLGDWFYDTGMWAMSGEMSEALFRQCSLILRSAPSSAPEECDRRLMFSTIQETLGFV